jgi:signal transduction histidine kinase
MAEALEDREREREEFIGLVAHELKSPLTVLRLRLEGALAQLEHGVTGSRESLKESLTRGRHQLSRVSTLIEVLLDASAFADPAAPLERSPVDLTELVRSTVAKEQRRFRAVGSEVTLELEGGVVGQWDERLLERLLRHLLSNALKFGRGEPVHIALHSEEGTATLSVSDRGIGIRQEDLERIFGRFERGVSPRHYGGLGLGLWLAREIAHRMNGEISVESAANQGSRFTVQLPLALDVRTPRDTGPQPSHRGGEGEVTR